MQTNQKGVWSGAPTGGWGAEPPHCKTFLEFCSLLISFKQITVTNQLSLLMCTFAIDISSGTISSVAH